MGVFNPGPASMEKGPASMEGVDGNIGTVVVGLLWLVLVVSVHVSEGADEVNGRLEVPANSMVCQKGPVCLIQAQRRWKWSMEM